MLSLSLSSVLENNAFVSRVVQPCHMFAADGASSAEITIATAAAVSSLVSEVSAHQVCQELLEARVEAGSLPGHKANVKLVELCP